MTVTLFLLCVSASRPAGADASCTGSGPGVVVHLPGGGTETVDGAQLAAEADIGVQGPADYETRAVTGGPTQSVPVTCGLSIGTLLGNLHLSTPPSFTEVTRPDETWATLSGAELDPPSSGQLPPVISVDGGIVQYLRPLGSASDVNITDQIRSGSGDALDLFVHTGPLLSVSVTANPAKSSPQQQVSFSAGTSASGASLPLTYSWTFGDGTTSTLPQPIHAYGSVGTYVVLLTVAGPDDSGGVSMPIAVTVGKPAPSRKPSPSPHAASASVHRPGALASPTVRVATTSRSAGPAAASATAVASSAAPRASASPEPSPSLASSAPVVTGLLVGDGSVIDPASASAAAQREALAPEETTSTDGKGVTPALAGGAVGLCLLGLGAARELRGRVRR